MQNRCKSAGVGSIMGGSYFGDGESRVRKHCPVICMRVAHAPSRRRVSDIMLYGTYFGDGESRIRKHCPVMVLCCIDLRY